MIQPLILVIEHGINFPQPCLLDVSHIPQLCPVSKIIYITILLLNGNSLSTLPFNMLKDIMLLI